MTNLWNRGGLTWRELFVRTVRESWQDNVFGQAARLAFYHFLALFPSLLLLFLVSRPGSAPESSLRDAFTNAVRHLLPARVALLVSQVAADLHSSVLRLRGIWVGAASALWASINGAYALIDGLNAAYEVEERRSFVRVVLISLALTAVVATLAILALPGGQYAAAFLARAGFPVLAGGVRWFILTIALFVCFAVFFRVAPNLEKRQWQWSTPGAAAAALIWIGSTIVFRLWNDRFNSYPLIYGRVAPAVSLLIWLYVTGGAVLIGGEMNSEIEKAAAEGGRDREISRAKKPGL
jgi:membrane protein